jgi:hypothetical protein
VLKNYLWTFIAELPKIKILSFLSLIMAIGPRIAIGGGGRGRTFLIKRAGGG